MMIDTQKEGSMNHAITLLLSRRRRDGSLATVTIKGRAVSNCPDVEAFDLILQVEIAANSNTSHRVHIELAAVDSMI